MALTLQILSNQRAAKALLTPWPEEVAAQSHSVGSAGKLATAYGGRGSRA